jgi:hypothetical protein
VGTDGTYPDFLRALEGAGPTQTSNLLFRVLCSSFAWAGVFSCHRNFRHCQLSLSHALGTKTLSAIRATALLDLHLLSTPAKLATTFSC